MTELNWHDITEAEVNYELPNAIVDLGPDWIPDQAAEYRGSLVRTSKPGWSWYARVPGKLHLLHETGTAETKEQALADALAAVDKYLAKTKLMTEQEITGVTKRRRWI